MKKTLKLTLLAFTLLCSACSTSKQLQTKNTDTVQYQLPACHQAIHQQMLYQQKRYNNLF
ncbi:hypothetical protein D1638_01130 [Muribaculaceae bacterium Z1]|uniref:hypothetical protein n=1 Tax=Bacteroidales TaxID=171549 RepID=UPI00137E93E8|nr:MULTISPECIES: hypothetical protein [Bacteroidales]NBH91201.1 hypothetical protein [Muribaculaceae bacterium S4]NBI19526.1 hypothetical protein [Muribaculaceae bacterium Z1]